MHQVFVSVTVEVLVASHCAKVAMKVLVALHLCIQSCGKGFGGSVSAHTVKRSDKIFRILLRLLIFVVF